MPRYVILPKEEMEARSLAGDLQAAVEEAGRLAKEFNGQYVVLAPVSVHGPRVTSVSKRALITQESVDAIVGAGVAEPEPIEEPVVIAE